MSISAVQLDGIVCHDPVKSSIKAQGSSRWIAKITSNPL